MLGTGVLTISCVLTKQGHVLTAVDGTDVTELNSLGQLSKILMGDYHFSTTERKCFPRLFTTHTLSGNDQKCVIFSDPNYLSFVLHDFFLLS